MNIIRIVGTWSIGRTVSNYLFFLDVISVNKLMCQKVLFGEKDVMELLQKEGQNVNQTVSRARPFKKILKQVEDESARRIEHFLPTL